MGEIAKINLFFLTVLPYEEYPLSVIYTKEIQTCDCMLINTLNELSRVPLTMSIQLPETTSGLFQKRGSKFCVIV